MEKKRRNRYLLAVYLIVGGLAVVLLLVGLNYASGVWQSIWLNLATGLIGVALLFFLVDRYFLADEWSLSDRIEHLIARLELSDRPSAKDFFIKPPVLDDTVRNATIIDLCGVTLTGTINKQFGNLRERVKQGAAMRVLIADPDSLALTMSALRSEKPDDIAYYSQRLEATFRDVGYIYESLREAQTNSKTTLSSGTFEVRMLPYAPSFGIGRFEGVDKLIYVEIFPHKMGYLTPPTFYVTPERDGDWYTYFANQFEDMWKKAKPWEPITDPEKLAETVRPDRRSRVPVKEFLHSERYLPDHVFEEAQTILLSGLTLSRTTRHYLRPMGQRLASGANVNIMIIEPKAELLRECVRRSSGQSTPGHWKKRLESTISLVEVLAGTTAGTGKLELRLLPYLPSFGFVAVDPDTDHGMIIVELYHHRSDESNPIFELRANRDGDWYQFFRSQFMLMWESSKVKQLPEPTAVGHQPVEEGPTSGS